MPFSMGRDNKIVWCWTRYSHQKQTTRGTHEYRLTLKNSGKVINKQPDLAGVAE